MWCSTDQVILGASQLKRAYKSSCAAMANSTTDDTLIGSRFIGYDNAVKPIRKENPEGGWLRFIKRRGQSWRQRV